MPEPVSDYRHAWPIPYYAGLAVVLLLIALPLFAHLEDWPIRWWDEARLATNALEMSQNNNWIVTHYWGEPDMWNTKPPLMVWLMALSIKIFGYNELAVRLPAALASVGTCLLLYWFAARRLQKPLLGILAVLVLITAPGFMLEHVARTGDYDALLICLSTAYSLLFFWFLEEKKNSTLLWFFVALSAAALTKGIAGLLFCPALLLYALLRKEIISILKNKYFYLGLLLFLVLVPGYYLLREQYNPGYWQAVKANELGGRYLNTLEDHHEPAGYYFRLLVKEYFKNWFLLLPFGIMAGLFLMGRQIRRFTAYLLLLTGSFLAVISTGGTKLSWYAAPLLPFLALLVALMICFFAGYLSRAVQQVKSNRPALVFLLLLMAVPYLQALDTALNPPPAAYARQNELLAAFLQEINKGRLKEDHFKVLDPPDQNIAWYVTVLRLRGKDIAFTEPEALHVGERVLVGNGERDEYLRRHFDEKLLLEKDGVKLYELTGPEPSE